MGDETDWSKYAIHYDNLCSLNASYFELVEGLSAYFKDQEFSDHAVIADIGAGTGNFMLEVSGLRPDLKFIHIDSNDRMNAIAAEKYQARKNIEILNAKVEDLDFPAASFDMVVCINTLFATKEQEKVVSKIHYWLKKGGIFYVVDLGRVIKPLDWGLHLLLQAIRRGNFLKYISQLVRETEALKQNRSTAKAQKSGVYWQHTTVEFENFLLSSGFEVLDIGPCYRNYCDRAICKSL